MSTPQPPTVNIGYVPLVVLTLASAFILDLLRQLFTSGPDIAGTLSAVLAVVVVSGCLARTARLL